MDWPYTMNGRFYTFHSTDNDKIIYAAIPYSWKIWRELNLVDCLESAQAKNLILVDLNLVVRLRTVSSYVYMRVKNIGGCLFGSCRHELPNTIVLSFYTEYIPS